MLQLPSGANASLLMPLEKLPLPLSTHEVLPLKKSLTRQTLSVPAMKTLSAAAVVPGHFSKRAMNGTPVFSMPLSLAVNDAPPLIVRRIARFWDDTAQLANGLVVEIALSAPS